jgi:cytochrome c-type biogenesis protein
MERDAAGLYRRPSAALKHPRLEEGWKARGRPVGPLVNAFTSIDLTMPKRPGVRNPGWQDGRMLADAADQIQQWWAPAIAFAAGVVSFASPCVLPLVPGFLSFVTGETATGAGSSRTASGPSTGVAPPGPGQVAVRTRTATWTRMAPIALFVLGFTVVFTLIFGFTASALSTWLRSTVGQRVAGVIVLLFGVFMLLYAFKARIPGLYREGRPFLAKVTPGKTGAFLLGMAFAVGWTPCIGPVLGAIVTLAAGQGSTGRSVLLLFAYSLGLGLPFVLVGLGLSRLLSAGRFFARSYSWFAGISGAFLVLIGLLLVSGQWTRLIAPVFRAINRFTPAL